MPKRIHNTDLIELVETHNIALSLRRLSDVGPYDSDKWRRALYHALCMTRAGDKEERGRIRVAMNLE